MNEDKWEATLPSLEEGSYTLIAKAFDNEGQEFVSNSVSLTIDMTAPEIEITHPNSENYYIQQAIITGVTEPSLLVNVVIDGFNETFETVAEVDGSWLIDLTSFLEEGAYTIHANTTDEAGNIGYSEAVSFVLDQTRPFITPNMFPRNNMTRVDLETVIKFNFVDDHSIDAEDLLGHPLELFKKGSTEKIPGIFTYNQKENNQIEIIFTPDTGLDPNSKYYVYTNPFLTDRAGNLVNPRFWSFTTTSNFQGENPHGNYESNVNTCVTCHSTHKAPKPKLKDPSEQLTSATDANQAFSSYCLACHDGTVAAPPTNWGSETSHHFQLTTNEGRVVSQSCGSCHNPHLTWSERNPTIFQDHFTFEHTVDLEGIDEPFFADSKEQLCESCHERDALTRKIDERVNYTAFTYRNWNTSIYELGEGLESFGEVSDYTLCLRCHNASYEQDYQNVVDIASFYQNENSAHFITNDRVKEGSLLDGHLPCADCHQTHGSENVKLIKSELGHYNRTTFTQTTTEWSASEERSFCLSCHNNSTEVYGMTVSISEEIPEHQSDSQISCATCHGGASQSFLEAVHAPSRK